MIYRAFFLICLLIMPFRIQALSPQANSDYEQAVAFEKQEDYVKAREWFMKAAAQPGYGITPDAQVS